AAAVRRNEARRHETIALLLARSKLEELRESRIQDPVWTPGGNLDCFNPSPGYVEYIDTTLQGAVVVSDDAMPFRYIRLWQIRGSGVRTVTVVVCTNPGAGLPRPRELVRLTGARAGSF